MGIALFEARKANRERRAELVARHEELRQWADAEAVAQEKARRSLYDEALVPFGELFARIVPVRLADLAAVDAVAAVASADLEHRTPGSGAARAARAAAALTGGALAGAGTGAAVYTAVGVFATASTGTALSGLSGAAATSGTLAWLGGGSLAAGGGGVAAGTAVLTGIVAAPVVLSLTGFLVWEARRVKRSQREEAEYLDRAEAELTIVERRTSALCERSLRIRRALRDLRSAIADRLPSLRQLVDEYGEYGDFATYPPAQQAAVTGAVGLVVAAIEVMRHPIEDGKGRPDEAGRRAVERAEALLRDLAVAA
ncbi:hypothetical protein [Streptomyces sp. NPDC053427]|uniref:hypothetical protein n=1 Tax=Streptomyces sp. NPDC053427 TaxID=3365701 RepID=UPI0037D9679A